MEEKVKDTEKVNRISQISAGFIKEEASKIGDPSRLLSDSNLFFEERKKIQRFVNQKIKPENPNKWELRKAVIQTFEELGINLQEDSPEKILFMLYTDSISEIIPTPAPLLFFYEGAPLVKKHGIVVDFNLLPELLNRIEELDHYKKHQLVLELFPEDETVIEGVSLKLAQLNFLILNLLDKILYEEVVPFDRIMVNKDGRPSVDKSLLTFVIVSIFASLFEAITGEKQQFKGSFYTAELSKLFVKIKSYIKKIVADREELEYLLYVSKLEEASIENRIITIRSYETQKNVFEESLRRDDVTTGEKIESIIWLLGIKNVNPVLLLRYYQTDDVLYYIFELFRQAQDEGFQTEVFLKEMKTFLTKLFRYPYISKGLLNQKVLDKPVKLFYSEDPRFNAGYFYFTQRFDRFLDMEELIKDKDEELKLKNLFARYFTDGMPEEELKGWLALSKTDEGQFFHHYLSKTAEQIPENNSYSQIGKVISGKKKPEEVIDSVGEEGYYTLILRLAGYYPLDKNLIKLADLRFEYE
ncbi:hypothetical protein [Persephonella sp.]